MLDLDGRLLLDNHDLGLNDDILNIIKTVFLLYISIKVNTT